MANEVDTGAVVRLLRTRAKAHALRRFAMLGLVVVTLLSTGIAVWLTGRVVQGEADVVASGPSTLQSQYAVIDAVNSALIANLTQKLPKNLADNVAIETAQNDRIRSANQFATLLILEENRLNTLLKAQAAFVPTVAAIVTRIALAVLGLFLVQVFVGSYRLAARLSASYEAFADALELRAAGATDDFKTLVAALSPALDFGKAPASPAKDLVDLAALLGKPRQ